MNFIEFNKTYFAIWGENALGVYTEIELLLESSKYVHRRACMLCRTREQAEYVAITNYNAMQRNENNKYKGKLFRDNWLCFRNNMEAY